MSEIECKEIECKQTELNGHLESDKIKLLCCDEEDRHTKVEGIGPDTADSSQPAATSLYDPSHCENQIELDSDPVECVDGQLEDTEKLRDLELHILSNPKPPPNYLIWAIFVTVCCFVPTGIMAIITSAEVTKLYRAGLQRDAKYCSDRVRFWIKVSISIGIGINFVGGILILIFMGSHILKTHY